MQKVVDKMRGQCNAMIFYHSIAETNKKYYKGPLMDEQIEKIHFILLISIALYVMLYNY